ncbi:hypothetical protein GGI43DRAFT_408187 [Trichoderma evansii]
MSQSDNWPSDDDDTSDSQSCHILPSDSDDSPLTAPVSKSRLRPAGKAPAHVPPAAEDLDTSDEEEPESTIPYNVEWKLSINHRKRAGQSELDIVESPQKFRLTGRQLCCPPLTVALPLSQGISKNLILIGHLSRNSSRNGMSYPVKARVEM